MDVTNNDPQGVKKGTELIKVNKRRYSCPDCREDCIVTVKLMAGDTVSEWFDYHEEIITCPSCGCGEFKIEIPGQLVDVKVEDKHRALTVDDVCRHRLPDLDELLEGLNAHEKRIPIAGKCAGCGHDCLSVVGMTRLLELPCAMQVCRKCGLVWHRSLIDCGFDPERFGQSYV